MRFVLDASVLVPLVVSDPFSERMDAWLRYRPDGLVVSDFASAEASSAIARRVREGSLTASEGRHAFGALDLWVLGAAERVAVESADIAAAQRAVRLLGPPLRTPDAIHLALAHRLGATLVTFDRQLASAARALSLPLADA